jgi:hypothetical protein
MRNTRLSGLEQEVVGGTEGGRSPTAVPPTTSPRLAPGADGQARRRKVLLGKTLRGFAVSAEQRRVRVGTYGYSQLIVTRAM